MKKKSRIDNPLFRKTTPAGVPEAIKPAAEKKKPKSADEKLTIYLSKSQIIRLDKIALKLRAESGIPCPRVRLIRAALNLVSDKDLLIEIIAA